MSHLLEGGNGGRACGPGAEIGAGSFPAGLMAEAALEAVRRALQEFPAEARGEWTPIGSRDRARTARRAWGAGNSDYVCMGARPVATHFRVYPSLAGGRVLSSRSHALVASWGAVVVFKTQHSSDGSHSAILKASRVLSPCALHCCTFGRHSPQISWMLVGSEERGSRPPSFIQTPRFEDCRQPPS